MAWRYGTWEVTHAVPLGVETRRERGETVAAGDIIATGTAVGSAVRVSGARRIGVAPADLDAHGALPVGATVGRGALLAGRAGLFQRAARSPLDGRIVHRSGDGDFYVAPSLDRWVVRSTMAGRVLRADDAAIVVQGPAWALAGIAAYGPDAIGELALGVDAPMDELSPSRIDVRLRGRILVGGARIAAEAITRGHACGLAGLVAGAAPAGGLRVVFGDEVTAGGLVTREDRPTVLCLAGFGSAALPPQVFLPLVAFAGSRAAIDTASCRLFVFAPPDAADVPPDPPALALADDYGGVRPLEGTSELVGVTAFASEVSGEALSTPQGAVPYANVRPFDAPR